MQKNKFGFMKLLCKGLVLAFIISILGSPICAFAKTEESDPAKSLIVNILNPDGTTTLVHEYLYEELAPLETTEYYATIDAMPIGVGTKAKGVKIHKLIEDAKQYNPNIKWESGQKLVFYVTDTPIPMPYQGSNYYTYDFLYGQNRYYFPKLVETYDPEYPDEVCLDGAVLVEPMLSSASYQEREATDEILKNTESPVKMDNKEAFRFCMGITEEEATKENFSTTNKFARWVYRVDVGPINGQRLKADKTDNEVGQPIEITFTDEPAWREAITQIKVNEDILDSDNYEITEGKITIKPGVFTKASTYKITVEATGFMNSTVDQKITQSIPSSYTIAFKSDGEVYKTESVEAGQTIDAPTAPAKEGYTFDGWYEDEDFNNKATFPYTVTKDVTLYAKWTAIPTPSTYAINVAKTNGGAVNVSSATGKEGDTITLTITPEKGKRLVEGSLKYTTDGGKSYTTIEGNSFTMPVSDVTITCEFENISYQYTVHPQEDAIIYDIGQTTDGIKTMTVKSGIEGMKYFRVQIMSIGKVHEGNETVVFVHLRDGKQLSINTTVADFDTVDASAAGFNVKEGDIIKVYLVDELTNDDTVNPIIMLQ